MATPRVLGQRLRLTANLCLAREASVITLRQLLSFVSPSNPFQSTTPRRRTQEGLVCPATTSNDTDHAAGVAGDDLLGARGELDAGLALIRVVADDGDVVARGAAESTTVADLLLDVGNDGTLRDRGEGEDVADGQGGVLAGVDELARVHALVGDEGLGDLLEAVGRLEDDAGERGTTAGVVDDLLHDTPDVAMALGVVEAAELGGGLAQARVGSEDAAGALALVADLNARGATSVQSIPQTPMFSIEFMILSESARAGRRADGRSVEVVVKLEVEEFGAGSIEGIRT
jgi:hypothetical protein